MDLSNLSERDRKTVEDKEQKRLDIKIVEGLISKGYSDDEIAKQMGSPVAHILYLKRLGKLQ